MLYELKTKKYRIFACAHGSGNARRLIAGAIRDTGGSDEDVKKAWALDMPTPISNTSIEPINPCPYCGEPMAEGKIYNSEDGSTLELICDNCGAGMAITHCPPPYEDDEEEQFVDLPLSLTPEQ